MCHCIYACSEKGPASRWPTAVVRWLLAATWQLGTRLCSERLLYTGCCTPTKATTKVIVDYERARSAREKHKKLVHVEGAQHLGYFIIKRVLCQMPLHMTSARRTASPRHILTHGQAWLTCYCIC
jgi:hypothetical protein